MKSAALSGRLQDVGRFLKFILLAALLFSLKTGTGQAQEGGSYTRWDKGGRGLGNIATGWFELVNQPVQLAKTQDWDKAVFTGFLKGVVYGVGRTLTGAYELVTAPIPNSGGYGPIMQPELIVPGVFHDKAEWDEKKIQRVY